MSSDVLNARSALGVATRSRNRERIAEARRDLAAANIEACIQRSLIGAPALSAEQLDRIATALLPGRGAVK